MRKYCSLINLQVIFFIAFIKIILITITADIASKIKSYVVRIKSSMNNSRCSRWNCYRLRRSKSIVLYFYYYLVCERINYI